MDNNTLSVEVVAANRQVPQGLYVSAYKRRGYELDVPIWNIKLGRPP